MSIVYSIVIYGVYTADMILLCSQIWRIAGGIRGRINKGVDRLFDHIVRPVLQR